MSSVNSLPDRPLKITEVNALSESDSIEILPVSLVMETNLVYSAIISLEGSDELSAVAFEKAEDEWIELEHATSEDRLRELWDSTEKWVNQRYSEEHVMGDADLENKSVDWTKNLQE